MYSLLLKVSKFNINGYYPLRAIYEYMSVLIKKDFIEDIEGHYMLLDSKDSLSLSVFKTFEPLETEVVKKEIKEGDVAVDIGANIGYYTLIFAKLVGKKGLVYAFEPDLDNFEILKKNIKLNNYNNVILINKAVSNKNGKLKLYLSEKNLADHYSFDSNDGRKSIDVDCVSIDEYFRDIKIDFIKMDIQGYEYIVFDGMRETLKNNNDLKIVTEFYPMGIFLSGRNSKNYLKALLSYGFNITNINEEDNKIEELDINKVLKKYNIKEKNFTNFLCKR